MKIYLAAIESIRHEPIFRHIKNAFYSYYYMRGSKSNSKNLRDHFMCHEIVFVDSGAHSFFAEEHAQGLSVGSLKKKTKTKESPNDFFEGYLKWLIEHYPYYDYYAELDIGELVGQDVVMQWRERLKEHNIYDKCVTVYHPEVVSWDDFIKMLDDSESRYIALEGDRDGRDRLNYNQLIKECYHRNVKVHGFAMTKIDVMMKYPFYSVDSSSWKAGVRFARQGVWNGYQVLQVNCNSKDLCESHVELNPHLIHEEPLPKQHQNRLILSAQSYNEAEKYHTEIWKKRGIIWQN